MRRKITAIIAGTMLAITGVPASATAVNTNGQDLANARKHSRQVVVERLAQRFPCRFEGPRRRCR